MGQRIVIKLGTSTLTEGTKRLFTPRLIDLVRQVAALRSQGHWVVLVSSGAIAAGREALGYPALPSFIPAKQMLAAVGQPRLMAIYEQFFAIYNEKVAQVLLTRADLTDRRRFLNARNTFDALLAHKIIPIVNENDTVATEEIRFGDNDNLSAQVANLIEADLLVLLTDQEGLFTDDPRQNPQARLIQRVDAGAIPDEIWQAAGGAQSGLGTGGMVTKLQAADLARHGGTTVYIAKGDEVDVLLRIARGETIGTQFVPVTNKLEGRKRYILAGGNVENEIVVDAGACRALGRGGSLLPPGVINVRGDFDRGDTVRVVNTAGKTVALGLVNYPANDIRAFQGRRSSEIEEILGYTFGDEVIHRNNLVVL